MADVLDLQKRVADLAITPKAMVGGAAELIEEVASKKISGEEDRYSRTDLWDFQANLDGARKIVDLLAPLVSTRRSRAQRQGRGQFRQGRRPAGQVPGRARRLRSYDKLAPKIATG